MLGKLVRLLQPCQARDNDVALLVLIAGKLVRLEHPSHAPEAGFPSPNRVTLAVLISGKLVRLLQTAQAPASEMAELKFSKGKELIWLQLYQVPSPTPVPPK